MKMVRSYCWLGLLCVVLILCWPAIHFLLGVLLGVVFLAAALAFKGILFVGKLSETLLLILAAVILGGFLWITRGR